MYEYLLQSDLTYLHTFVLNEIAISDLLLYGSNALQVLYVRICMD